MDENIAFCQMAEEDITEETQSSENDTLTSHPIRISETQLVDEKLDYTQHIIDTHFHTFNWLDVKMQALLAIAAASLAAATFIIKDLKGVTIYETIPVILACVLLIIGMIISLWHLMPILDSGVGNVTNPRVAIGIVKIPDKENFHDIIRSLDKEQMLEFNCFQIYGLAKICKTGQSRLSTAIILIGSGLIIIAVTVSFWGVKNIIKTSTSVDLVSLEKSIKIENTSPNLNKERTNHININDLCIQQTLKIKPLPNSPKISDKP